ncbi:MAG: hemolysin III family protein [Clostridiales bacterium]|nr:hemolysin III family protein [Clostridiales bacterium]
MGSFFTNQESSSQRKPGSFYTLAEEIANAITHGIGALLAIAGGIVLIIGAAYTRDAWRIVSGSVYVGTLFLLFLMSTLYHALVPEKAKHVFRIFDHTMIYLLIAGSYTPITLVALNGAVGWTIFGIVWAIAIVGVVLTSVNLEKFKKFGMICYIAMGWCVVFAIIPMIRALETAGLILFFGGGVFYTGGLWFYSRKNLKYAHAIWHLFVLAGAILHYFAILKYIL